MLSLLPGRDLPGTSGARVAEARRVVRAIRGRVRPRANGTASQSIPEVGAVCGKAARTDLCGGREVTRVPIATGRNDKSGA
jgi:hypothetical protein